MALATEVFRSSSEIAASRLRRGWPVRRLLLVGTIACAGLLSGCGLDLIYVDWKLNKLCAQDGGVKVFITDKPPEEFLKSDRNVDLFELQRAKPGRSYFINTTWKRLSIMEVEVTRMESHLIRSRDDAVLSTAVAYIRPTQNVGVPLMHRQGHSCPQVDALYELVSQTFYSAEPVQK